MAEVEGRSGVQGVDAGVRGRSASLTLRISRRRAMNPSSSGTPLMNTCCSRCHTSSQSVSSVTATPYTEGVEPTNKLAERDLRRAVIWRKTRFGTQSKDGSRFVEQILTAVMSLRKQERNVLDSLTAALEAQAWPYARGTLLGTRLCSSERSTYSGSFFHSSSVFNSCGRGATMNSNLPRA